MGFSTFQGPDFVFNKIPEGAGDLPALLTEHARGAITAGRVPCVYLSASWCPANVKLEKALGDPRMQQSLREVNAATFDIDDWGKELQAAGFAVSTVPAFFILDDGGKPVGNVVTGAAWKDDIAENMAPPLGAFFDAARAQRTPPNLAPAKVHAARSKWVAVAGIAVALIAIGIAAWLKVSSDERDRHSTFEQEQHDRIQKSVSDSVHAATSK